MSALEHVGDDPHLGRVIDGRYRLLRRLGEGGMGVVFEAEHVKLGKHVALKIVAPDRLGDPEAFARFTREARATAQIEHPHIATGFDYGLLPEGGAFLVAQLVRGGSLRERIDRGPTAWQEACEIAAQIADALTAIHRAGYVHRDLTPENVLLTSRDDGRPHVYVLDFGVAALVAARAEGSGAATVVTEAGTVVGTHGYMAPEQALGRAVDARADLYVLGVLLWELIAGRRLFSSAGSMTEIVSAQLASANGALPSVGGADLPVDLERLLRDLLSPELERRPTSAAEVRAVLSRIAAGEPARAPEVKRDELGELKVLLAIARDAREAAKTPRGMLAAAIGAAAGLLVTLVAVVVAVIRGGGGELGPAPEATPAAAVVIAPSAPVDVLPQHEDDRLARLGSPLHREREAAATEILAADSSTLPPYARPLAALIVANTCDERAHALTAVRAIGDPRALGALERLRHAPRRGCGRRGRSDCYACIRDELDQTVAELRATAPRSSSP